MARPRDHERRPRAHDLGGLPQDHLDLARIAVVARELDGARRRLDLVEAHDPALDLRDGLLRDDDDVALLEPARRGAHASARSGRQIVALLELGQPGEADHADLAEPRVSGRR